MLDVINLTWLRSQVDRYPFSWARLVSDIMSPPVVMGLLALAVAIRAATTTGEVVLWVMIYASLACLLPLAYIAVMVSQGRITDMHMKERDQRLMPLLVTIICNGLAYALLRLVDAEESMLHLSLFTLIQLLLMAGVTLFWQISIHAISISGAVVAMAYWFGLIPALLVLPLVPLVGAARIQLKRHTIPQVLSGVLVGAIIPAILIGLIIG